MPTGYTANIYDGKGVTLKDFIVLCARAMGPCVHLRDSPVDGRLPEREESGFHAEQIEADRKELDALLAMSDDEKESAALAAYEKELECAIKRAEDSERLRARYLAMIDAVDKWTPPAPGHEPLKRFMLEQLRDSLRWDCQYDSAAEVKRIGADEWYLNRVDELSKSISYNENEMQKERDRCEFSNNWIRALLASLDPHDR